MDSSHGPSEEYDFGQFAEIYKDWKKDGKVPLEMYLNPIDKKIVAVYESNSHVDKTLIPITNKNFKEIKFILPNDPKLFHTSAKMVKIYLAGRWNANLLEPQNALSRSKVFRMLGFVEQEYLACKLIENLIELQNK